MKKKKEPEEEFRYKRASSLAVISADNSTRQSLFTNHENYDDDDLDDIPEENPGETPHNTPSEPGSHSSASSDPNSINGLYMKDKKRRIDFILVSQENTEVGGESKLTPFLRQMYEHGLVVAGLQLETHYVRSTGLRFLKIHAPWDTLAKNAEMLRFDMPLMKNDIAKEKPNLFHNVRLPEIVNYFTAPFCVDMQQNFHIEDEETFFSPAQRSAIVYHILGRVKFEEGDTNKSNQVNFGYEKLFKKKIYTTGFPLHSGSLEDHDPDTKEHEGKEVINLRHLLYLTWGRFQCFFEIQPIHHIRMYFGESYGFFFAWVGSYTLMLVPLSIIGLYVIVYGTINLFVNEETNEICDPYGPGNYTMCPQCHQNCHVWKLKEACLISQLSALVDNELAVLFAVFIVLWSRIFIEWWIIEEQELIQSWSLNQFLEYELIRPAYIELATKQEVNPVTGEDEPVVPKEAKYIRLLAGIGFVLCVSVSAILAFLLMVFLSSKSRYTMVQFDYSIQTANISASIVASLVFLVIFQILEKAFVPSATAFTNFEAPRTESDWEESYIIKGFIFRFLSSAIYIVYVAFVRDRYQITDDEKLLNYTDNKPGKLQLDIAYNSIIVIVGQQLITVIIRLLLNHQHNKNVDRKVIRGVTFMEKDYKKQPLPEHHLIDEYIGFMSQYGVLVCFAAFSPICAACALVTNLILIRLSAFDLLAYNRRPVARRIYGIGIFIPILKILSRIAMFSNAFLIMYSSDFLTRQLYIHKDSKLTYAGLSGYIEYLYKFRCTADYNQTLGNQTIGRICPDQAVCRFRGKSTQDIALTIGESNQQTVYWHVTLIQLQFLVSFVASVELFHKAVALILPMLTKNVRIQQMREAYLTKKLFEDGSTKAHTIPTNVSGHSDEHSILSTITVED